MGILYYAILESIGVLVTVSIHACNLHGVLPGPSQSKPHGAKKERTAFWLDLQGSRLWVCAAPRRRFPCCEIVQPV